MRPNSALKPAAPAGGRRCGRRRRCAGRRDAVGDRGRDGRPHGVRRGVLLGRRDRGVASGEDGGCLRRVDRRRAGVGHDVAGHVGDVVGEVDVEVADGLEQRRRPGGVDGGDLVDRQPERDLELPLQRLRALEGDRLGDGQPLGACAAACVRADRHRDDAPAGSGGLDHEHGHRGQLPRVVEDPERTDRRLGEPQHGAVR